MLYLQVIISNKKMSINNTQDNKTTNKLFAFLDNKYRIVHHSLFWSLYLTAQFIGVLADKSDFFEELFYVGFDILTVYINIYVLLPKLLLKNKGGYYFISIVGLLIIEFFGPHLVGKIFGYDLLGCCINSDKPFIYKLYTFFSIFFYIMLIQGTAVGLKLFKIWIKNQEKIRCLETENLKTELAYLKNQMNPHFLFNTLNNIYIQIKINKQMAEKTILDLSDLLRYQLYDCSNEFVSILDEISYLNNYLQIERIRKDKVEINFPEPEIQNNIKIAPFLFIPFVENAIKHGETINNKNFININLCIDDKILKFKITNSANALKSKNKNKKLTTGGVGLANVKRRLELLYFEKYKLYISTSKETYSVELIINLDKNQIL